jgi:hypothetical protein
MSRPFQYCSVALILALAVTSAHAALNSKHRVRAFAALPDWTGYWEQDSIKLGVGGEPVKGDEGFLATKLWQAHPPYNAEWEARYKARPEPPEHVYCQWGFPAILDSPYTQFELVVTPEQTLFIPVMLHATRQIFTDGRSHPAKDDLWATPSGDSIGHWEGQTLVVDTIARKAGPIADVNDLSEQAHFVERIRLLDKDRMEDQMVIEDPVALARPWPVTLTYRRMKGVDRLVAADCVENDRNPLENGIFKIEAPKP